MCVSELTLFINRHRGREGMGVRGGGGRGWGERDSGFRETVTERERQIY